MNDKLKTAIIAFRNGELEAFTEIYNLQYNHVYFIALQHAKNEHEAQDIAQESFIEIYRSLGTLKEVSYFNAWINRIVYSFFIKSIRSKQVSKRVHLDETVNLEDIVYSDEQNNPSEIYISDELMEAVEDSFGLLSITLQEVARMRYFDELSITEISEVLDLPEGTIKSRLHKIRSILQEKLSGEYKQVQVTIAPIVYLYFKNAIDATNGLESSSGVRDVVALAAVSKVTFPKKKRLPNPSSVVGGAAVLASPLIVVGLMNSTPPVVDTVEYETQWTHQSISAQVSFAKDNPNNQRVRVELNGGPVYLDDQGGFSIDDNGQLTITYDQEVLYSTTITSIDLVSPKLQLEQTGSSLVISLADDDSGVDFESLKVKDGRGQLVEYERYQDKISFEKDNEDTYLIAGQDIAGNAFEYEIQTVDGIS